MIIYSLLLLLRQTWQNIPHKQKLLFCTPDLFPRHISPFPSQMYRAGIKQLWRLLYDSLIYIVRSAWTMSPAHPPVMCFFSQRFKRCLTYSCIFEADFALKSRGFSGFGSPSGRDKKCEICCENNVRGLGIVGKIYQARTLCQNMVRHCPSKADFTASKEKQQCDGSCLQRRRWL